MSSLKKAYVLWMLPLRVCFRPLPPVGPAVALPAFALQHSPFALLKPTPTDTTATVSGTLNKPENEGCTLYFNLNDNCIGCHGNSLQTHPDEFVADGHYRFEGFSDPGDEAVVYAISSIRHNMKGR